MKEFEGETSFLASTAFFIQKHRMQILNVTHIMDTVVKIVNCICAGVLNHFEFVALLGEIEFGETMYHTKVRWLCCTSVLQLPF
jgi:hypothetical protein